MKSIRTLNSQVAKLLTLLIAKQASMPLRRRGSAASLSGSFGGYSRS
jgi:hypothetical protein